MANIKSAKKRINVAAKKHLRNKSVKSATKTAVKKVLAAVEAGETAQVQEAHRLAISAIDRAASKGIYHKNTASRKKSRLARIVNG